MPSKLTVLLNRSQFEALYNIAINEITSLLQEEVVNFSKIRNKKKTSMGQKMDCTDVVVSIQLNNRRIYTKGS